MMSAIPGTHDDIVGRIDLEAEHPFFGSSTHADRFVTVAILPLVSRWRGRRIRLVDFGGGQGLLAERCAHALRTHGVDAHACVVDANPVFVAQARARGLDGLEVDIRRYAGEPADLALMRLVLHYNPAPAQREMLEHVCRQLAEDGLFVLQFESGEVAACALRNGIAAMSAQSTGATPRFWADIEAVHDWLRGAGFTDLHTVDAPMYDSDVMALVRDAWQRQRAALVAAGVTEQAFYRACTDRVFAARRAGGALYERSGRLTMKTFCPIVRATRAQAHPGRGSRSPREGGT